MQEWDLYSDKSAQRSRAYYYANITFIDEQVGRILDELENQELADNTLVLFTADHGDMLGDHDMWYKSHGYEGSVHVPMLMRWPGKIKPNSRIDDVSSLLDIYPTFATAAGLGQAEGRPGENLMELIAGTNERDMVFSEIGYDGGYHIYVRHQDWKYIFYQNGSFEELYNLVDDPKELDDLSKDAAYQDKLAELRKAGEQWIAKHSDGGTFLDTNGNLKKYPYKGETDLTKVYNRATRPYSRMPWDSRSPAGALDEDQRPWWWREVGGDWSQLIEYAKKKKK